MTYRVLVTGSRSWTDRTAIRLAFLAVDMEAEMLDQRDIVLVSGACPSGADAMAEEVARELGWTVERHPADWKTYGKRAGFVRNNEMVRLGADLCVAFIRDGSRGASMTVDLAEKAGIPVRRYECL